MRKRGLTRGLSGLARLASLPSWLSVKHTGQDYHSADGQPHYAGQVGTGFSDKERTTLRDRLQPMSAPPPRLLAAGETPDRQIRWILRS